MRPVRTHTFAGSRYSVRSQAGLDSKTLAECDFAKRVIRVPVDGDTLDELDWIIHESLHACYPWLAEAFVDTAATSVARLLWRLGWRKGEG